MSSDLLTQIVTKKDALVLASEIDLLLSALYQDKGQGFEKALRDKVRAQTASFVRSMPGEKDEALKELKTKLSKLPEVTITLAFEPNQSLLTRIQEMAGKKDAILDVKIDKSLIGGAVIEFGGKIMDYTLAKELAKIS